MIKANELRIGNLIYNTKGNVSEVNIEALAYILKEPHHQCKPIPLTEEWLLKFRFEKDGGIFHNEIVLYENTKRFSYNANYFEHDNLIDIKYVHQLQNLYFALTGEELTVKK